MGANTVVYLSLDEVYLDLRFTAWGGPSSGGMFAYERAEPPTTASGDYNGNNVVDAADYTIWRRARSVRWWKTPATAPTAT